jgi:hypothetical protein
VAFTRTAELCSLRPPTHQTNRPEGSPYRVGATKPVPPTMSTVAESLSGTMALNARHPPRILEIFNDLKRHRLGSGDQIVQTFQPQLTPLQQQVLDLLHIPASIYS